ncbi:MAG TPA: fibronectin type III domain-containing protein [Mycobacteriales bacterium]|nr:fibronectin type III domain-containing protein [Mycobacteriales bacterium]
MEQPLNGGTAHLIGIPPISNSSSHAVPTENNALVADSGINNIPDVERVDFMVYLTDQFGNLASWVPGGELPTLTISGPGSLYRCTGSSSTSACTGGTVLSSGSAVAGSYLDPDWQVRYQADTNNGSINLRYPCGATESGCVAANTATPGINDGTQTDTLQWSPPTTTFAAYVPGPPNIATYSAGTASAVTDSYSLSFYDQLATMSLAAPDAIVGVTETVTAVVANWDGTPVANKTVRFFVQGADTTTGSATTNSNGVARFTFLPAHPGSDNIQAFTDFDGDQVRELAEPDVSTDITVTSATVPSAPTSVSAVTGNGQAAVSWAAPSSDGGSPITGYDVQYSTNNGTTWTSASATFHTSTATSQTVTGLTNGTAYLFRVAAINSVGTGPYSAASAAVTPAAVPEAPTAVTATAGNLQATVTWMAPSATGGLPITGYDVQYSSNNGTSWTSASSAFHTSAATTETVTGLTNGTAYVFRVAAISSAGTGAYSAASAAVTPASVPGAPTAVTATAGDASAVVSWTAPADTGGERLTAYTVQDSSDGGTTWNGAATGPTSAAPTAPATTLTVTGLANGTAYEFRVAATNSAGTGAFSTPSAPVTPAADSSHLTIGASRTIDSRQVVTISTRLTDSTTHLAIPNAVLALEVRHAGSTWHVAHHATTDSSGEADIVLAPISDTDYKWMFAGDGEHASGTSETETVTARQVVSSDLTAHRIASGQTVEVYGTVTPDASDRNVALQRHAHGNWVTIARAILTHQKLPDGRTALGYILPFTGHGAGTVKLRVHIGPTRRNAAGTSRTLRVRVK